MLNQVRITSILIASMFLAVPIWSATTPVILSTVVNNSKGSCFFSCLRYIIVQVLNPSDKYIISVSRQRSGQICLPLI